jgi:predicted PurR-regulated permease PerM
MRPQVQYTKTTVASHHKVEIDRKTATFPTAATRALIVLAVVACGSAIWATQDFLMPTATAAVVALALNPVVRVLERAGLPTFIASIVVVVTAGGVLAGTAMAIAPGLEQLISRAPEIAQTIERKARPLKLWLNSIQDATDKLDEVTNIRAGESNGAITTPTQSSGGAVMELAPQVLAQTLYVLVLALFLISVRETFRKRLILLPTDRDNRLRVARILNEALTQVSHYLFVMTTINTGVALTVTLAFTLAGVPYAAVWGFVFGVACFIPYVGPTVIIALCAITQLVASPTIGTAIIAPIILLVINFFEASVITPWLVSRRIAVSSLAVFLTVALFAWLSGPFAAIVAVPLLILFSAIARHVPGLEAIAILLLAESETGHDLKKSGMEKLFEHEKAVGQETVKVAVWWSWLGTVQSVKAKPTRARRETVCPP